MKIIFGCIGFSTNDVFILDTNDKDARPIPYGTVVDRNRDKLEYWPENYMPDVVSEEQILQAYKKAVDKDMVMIYDVSKKAWLEDRFGEPKEDGDEGSD